MLCVSRVNVADLQHIITLAHQLHLVIESLSLQPISQVLKSLNLVALTLDSILGCKVKGLLFGRGYVGQLAKFGLHEFSLAALDEENNITRGFIALFFCGCQFSLIFISFSHS